MFSREAQALMEAAVDAVVVSDHRGGILAVNDAACRMFGYQTAELIGQNVAVLMPVPQAGAHAGFMQRHLETGAAKIIGVGREVMARRRDGSQFPAHLSVGRTRDDSPPRFVALLRDLSREHAANTAAHVAQERLMRVARLATLGEMATCVAHELNQPLTAITTYARACERYLAMPQPDVAEIREAIREIAEEGLRAGEIIRRLRQMVHTDSLEAHEDVDVNAMVRELATLLAADARAHGADLRIKLAEKLPRISANGVQLQHVLINLARNAFEAVQDAGPAHRYVEIATALTTDGDVEIRVSDSGPGIAPEIAGRLFDPFASTKGAGTGLGLAVSRTIVKSHGGTIDTRRGEPRGATFSVRLPVEGMT